MQIFRQRKNQSLLRIIATDRVARSFSYFLFALGGTVSLFYPSPIVEPTTSATIATVWAALLILGAVLSFTSIIINNWVYEYIGLPILSAGFVVYAICAFYTVSVDFPFYLTSGAFNLGVAAYLVSRFWTLRNKIYDSKIQTTAEGLE